MSQMDVVSVVQKERSTVEEKFGNDGRHHDRRLAFGSRSSGPMPMPLLGNISTSLRLKDTLKLHFISLPSFFVT